jgi:hypothetical protein
MEWLMFAEGAVVGGFTIVASVVIAFWQRLIQLHDRAADRKRERERDRERTERQSKIERRERWQPEYEEIRHWLDGGETRAYRVLDTGPYTTSELDAQGVTTFIIKYKILSERGIERLRNPLLELANRTADLQRHAMSGEEARVAIGTDGRTSDASQPRRLLREAVLQDRAAHGIADQIKAARQVLREEWGD